MVEWKKGVGRWSEACFISSLLSFPNLSLPLPHTFTRPSFGLLVFGSNKLFSSCASLNKRISQRTRAPCGKTLRAVGPNKADSWDYEPYDTCHLLSAIQLSILISSLSHNRA